MTDQNPLYQSLLGGAEPPSQDMLLAQLQQANPQMAALMRSMMARNATQAQVITVEPEPVNEVSEELRHAQHRLQRLEQLVRRMYGDLQAANDRLSSLAAALGACGLCWGEDRSCPCCRGRGRPGMFSADPELRERMLGDAFRPAPH